MLKGYPLILKGYPPRAKQKQVTRRNFRPGVGHQKPHHKLPHSPFRRAPKVFPLRKGKALKEAQPNFPRPIYFPTPYNFPERENQTPLRRGQNQETPTPTRGVKGYPVQEN